MVRKSVLVLLLAAANLLVVIAVAGIMWFVVLCPEPDEAHVDDPSAAASSPGFLATCRNGGGEDVICVRVLPLAACLFVLGLATGAASCLCYFLLGDDFELVSKAAGAASKKAGYVAIRDCAGGKHE